MSVTAAAAGFLMTIGNYLPAALPDPQPVAPPGFEAVATILGWAKWVALIIAILALIAVAVMFMINSRRGEGGEHVKGFVAVLVGVMVIGAATALVGFISGA